MIALHFLVQDLDSLDQDYWLYRDGAGERLWKFIPWDKNLTFGANFYAEHGGGASEFFTYDLADIGLRGNGLFTKLLQTPELRARVEGRVRELMKTFPPEYFRRAIERLRPVVEPSLRLAPGKRRYRLHPGPHHGEAGRLEDHLEALVDFVELRHQYLDRRLAPPSEASPYRARVDLRGRAAAERIYFTDSSGWVIATLDLAAATEATVTASVVPVEAALRPRSGVDRVWTLETEGGPVSGTLTLLYRNAPNENWTGELVAVGRERELRVELLGDAAGAGRVAETRVNPYSNKASAQVVLAGTQRVVLVYPELPGAAASP
jgi:spore coat protein H